MLCPSADAVAKPRTAKPMTTAQFLIGFRKIMIYRNEEREAELRCNS